LDALPARGQPQTEPTGPARRLTPSRAGGFKKSSRGLKERRLSAGFRTLSERLIRLKSFLHPDRTREILWDGVARLATLPHHRGTPARRAMLPGMHIPRLAREAGLARGCGERAHQESSSNHQKSSSARRTASPPPGVFAAIRPGPRLPRQPAGGRGSKDPPTRGHPLICPTSPSNLERSAVSPATHTVGGPGGPPSPLPPQQRGWPSQRPRNYGGDAGHPPAATPNVRDPLWSWGGSRREPTPRSPALNNVIEGSGILTRGWHLRLWAPFSSVFCLPLPSALPLSSGRALGVRSPRGAPSAPPIRGSPATPASWGYGRAPLPAVPLRERDDGPYPSPLQGKLPSDQERSRGATPLIREATTRRCRAGFRRCSQFLSQRPKGFRPRDWETVTAGPGGPVSHEAGRLTSLVEKRKYYHLIVLIRSLYIT